MRPFPDRLLARRHASRTGYRVPRARTAVKYARATATEPTASMRARPMSPAFGRWVRFPQPRECPKSAGMPGSRPSLRADLRRRLHQSGAQRTSSTLPPGLSRLLASLPASTPLVLRQPADLGCSLAHRGHARRVPARSRRGDGGRRRWLGGGFRGAPRRGLWGGQLAPRRNGRLGLDGQPGG